MIKYYMMAIENGNIRAIYDLSKCCEYFDHNYDQFYKSLIIAYQNNKISVETLEEHFVEEYMYNIIEYFVDYDIDISIFKFDNTHIKMYELIKRIRNLEKENLELKLRPPEQGGPLYEEVKSDFEMLQLKN